MDFVKSVRGVIENRNWKYVILTFGCQLNENDSEKIAGMLEEMGFAKTEVFEEADLVIFNTCCVRENAEERLFGKLGEIKKMKEQKGTMIAIGGCMMQEKSMLEKIKQSYRYVDIVFGTHTIQTLPEDLYKVIVKNEKVKEVWDIDGEIIEGLPIKRNNQYRASVTIMYGCNNFCSFCIVPYVRGRERSRNPEDILAEIRELAEEGYKEITLLGQNVNSYGNDGFKYCEPKVTSEIDTFAKLLRAINEIPGIETIKFMSPHPKDFKDDVIEAIKDCPKVSRLIHMPLQSGNTKVLREMNRRYTKEEYLALVQKMKEQIPNVYFSTDIIVGFPGETDEEFEDTLDVVRQVEFDQIFMFIYSMREGTRAAAREDQVPEEDKHRRFDKLKELYDSQVDKQNEKYIGTVQEILIEGPSKNDETKLTGRTASNKVVVFEANGEEKMGDTVKIKITENHKWFLVGEIV
ncbi:MAG: tRNA (N6-isopentenyl adenosine(37)-C2)-methylthiotransferase MiaB [Clostridia bacterium]|nr:tRNA (N6-isopentenyl adenosine(37)-C2)-methylthiotransferase MiaB [Clostridia bacterium]